MEQSIEKTMLPFKIQQLIEIIIKKKKCSLEDALHYLYPSNLYKQLTSEFSTLWQFSTLSLYEILKKEKLSGHHKQKSDSKLLLFLIFCLENYKDIKKMSADDSLHLFMKYDVFHYLDNVYEMLHTQSDNYIVAEIDTYITNKQINQ